jgi:DNA primase
MGRIPEDVIEKVREETAIEEVVGHFLRLQRSGTSFKALCPFHQEKTPSFHVNPQRQIFYCFGCHRGGDVFRFLMDREGMSYPEAIEWCASRLGLDVSRYAHEEGSAPDGRATVLAANAWAAGWFKERLGAPRGAAAREYVRARGLRPETIDVFGLGLSAPAGDDATELLVAAKAAGHDAETLLLAGLLMRRDNRGPLAYFRGRLIFPIRGVAQKVLGFGGRILGAGEPKYLNSPETTVFQKRRVLYALAEARASIVRKRSAILVEGYVDALALHQAGWTQTVATCGTALAPEQAALLARYADTVVLLLDGDAAGRKAAFRAADVALAAGLDVRIGRLAGGRDPADLVQADERETLRVAIEQAPDLVHRLAQVVQEREGGREVKERALAHLKTTLAAVRDPVRADLMAEEAEKVLGIKAALLRDQTARRTQPQAAQSERAHDADPGVVLERTVLRLALASSDARALLFTRLGAADLVDPLASELFRALHQRGDAAGAVNASLLDGLSPPAQAFAAHLMMDLPTGLPDAVAELSAALDALSRRSRRAEETLRRTRMNEQYAWGDGDWRSELARREAQGDDPTR